MTDQPTNPVVQEKILETGEMTPVSGQQTQVTPKIETSTPPVTPSANGSPTGTETPPVATAPVEPEMSEEKFYDYLTQNTGVVIKTEGDLKKALSEYKKFQDNPYGDVSDFMREVIKAEKSGIPPSRFIGIISGPSEQKRQLRATYRFRP